MVHEPLLYPIRDNPGAAPARDELAVLVGLWSLLIIEADLKSATFRLLHWAATALVFMLAYPELRRRPVSFRAPALLWSWGIVLATLLASFRAADPLLGLLQATKLGLILVAGLGFFLTYPGYGRPAMMGFVVAVLVNGVLLIAGWGLSLRVLASEMALGRLGTFLNFPGSLWRCGNLVLIWAAYLAISDRERRNRHLGILAIGLLLVVGDGSRTAFLLLPVAGAYLAWVFLVERGGRVRVKTVALVAALVVVAGGLVSLVEGTTPGADDAVSGLSRMQLLLSLVAGGGLDAIGDADLARFTMVSDAIAAIQRNPILGNGIAATRSDTGDDRMVIHMSYLQVWADLGILGFVSFVFLTLGWLSRAPRVLARIRAMRSPADRALFYNAVYLLGSFALTSLFHPLSTEWSEWLPFLVALGLFSEVAAGST